MASLRQYVESRLKDIHLARVLDFLGKEEFNLDGDLDFQLMSHSWPEMEKQSWPGATKAHYRNIFPQAGSATLVPFGAFPNHWLHIQYPQGATGHCPIAPKSMQSGGSMRTVAGAISANFTGMPNGNDDTNASQVQKSKRRKVKQESLQSRGCELVEEKCRSNTGRWKEHWVPALIHIRGELHDEFAKPPKQGVDLWQKVYMRLKNACPDFDKDSEACRKKWKHVYSEYKEYKASEKSSENERHERCKWYSLVDQYVRTQVV